jgi:hypothetical protein
VSTTVQVRGVAHEREHIVRGAVARVLEVFAKERVLAWSAR